MICEESAGRQEKEYSWTAIILADQGEFRKQDDRKLYPSQLSKWTKLDSKDLIAAHSIFSADTSVSSKMVF